MVKRNKPWNKKLSPLRKKEGLKMPAILEKEETKTQNLSTFHIMILNDKKRQEIFDYYDAKYQETEEANKFCKNMKTRRKLDK